MTLNSYLIHVKFWLLCRCEIFYTLLTVEFYPNVTSAAPQELSR